MHIEQVGCKCPGWGSGFLECETLLDVERPIETAILDDTTEVVHECKIDQVIGELGKYKTD